MGRFESRVVAVGPDDAVLLDLRDTMHIDFTDHGCLTLVVPRPLFAKRAEGAGTVGGRVFRSGNAEAALLGGLLAVAPSLPDALAEVAGLAAGARPPRGLPRAARGQAPASAQRQGPHGGVSEDRAFRARQPGPSAARPGDDGRHLRCSRWTLYALLGPSGGSATLVRRHRLAEAPRLLGTDEGLALSVEALARRCGAR